jgi:hypothetical protein
MFVMRYCNKNINKIEYCDLGIRICNISIRIHISLWIYYIHNIILLANVNMIKITDYTQSWNLCDCGYLFNIAKEYKPEVKILFPALDLENK